MDTVRNVRSLPFFIDGRPLKYCGVALTLRGTFCMDSTAANKHKTAGGANGSGNTTKLSSRKQNKTKLLKVPCGREEIVAVKSISVFFERF